MALPSSFLEALSADDVSVRTNMNLGRKLYWRAGGPADGFAKLGTLRELIAVQRAAAEHSVDVFVLGAGSNLLVSDAGIRGLVVTLAGELASTSVIEGTSPPLVQAGAGLKLNVLLNRAEKAGWTGLEVFAGIPGTVGGAVRMNAGATLGETVEALHEVDVVLRGGGVQTLSVDELRMSYRTSHLPSGAIVAQARLATTGKPPEPVFAAVRAFLDKRKASQPLHRPSCGSTFRNPPGDYAGRLIEASGLKGFRIGGAQVSELHANFILNQDNATATELRQVVEHVQAKVLADHGVALQREVHFVGDWSSWEPSS